MAIQVGWQPPLTVEERWAQGSMGPEDVLMLYKRTGGKIKGVAKFPGV